MQLLGGEGPVPGQTMWWWWRGGGGGAEIQGLIPICMRKW